MKRILSLLIFATFIFAQSCKKEKKEDIPVIENSEKVKTETKTSEVKKVKFLLLPKSNSNVNGSAFFREENGYVTFAFLVNGLTPGTHAIHIHESADCTSEDGKSAGGHWNPTAQPHGKWGDKAGFHKGDIGNFEADEKGIGRLEFTTDQWCIGCGDETKDILGKSIIVHEKADDYSQPTGAAGGRVSCGGIIE